MKKEEPKKEAQRFEINTGASTYKFSKEWVENDALNDILAGLVADDLNRQSGKADG